MIQISENAAKHIMRVKSEEKNSSDTTMLRVKAITGGCSGMSYKLDFDSQINDGQDKTFEAHGVTVVVDKKSYLYLVGMTLDYSGGLNGQGFVFSNPNASRTCGCGASFGV